MINQDKIYPVIEGYKKYFPEHWKNEKYKWEAVKHFQDNWDINAEDFGLMFERATNKTKNLLSSMHHYPRGMILDFVKADGETTKQMFIHLYDESIDLTKRIDNFMKSSEEMRTKYDDGTWKNHYQNLNAISVYLWLRYPDKYYIYKYEIYKAVADELESGYPPIRRSVSSNIIGGYAMYDEICRILQDDEEIQEMLDNALTENCYPDTALKTLTIDFGFYLCRFYLDDETEETTEANNFLLENNTIQTVAKRYWLYAPGENAFLWDEFYNEGIMGIGWDEIDNLKHYYTRDAMKRHLQIFYHSTKQFYSDTLALWQFAYEIKPGDIVIAKKGLHLIVGYGIVISDYYYDEEREIFKHIRKVKWIYDGEWEYHGQLAMKTLTDITDNEEYVKKLLNLIKNSSHEPLIPHNTYTKENFLSDVFMSEKEYDKLTALLKRKKNIVLQGAPGVGKTFCAKRLAWSVMGEKNNDRVCTVQFHQSYSYEDFIMGYRPTDNGGFELENGVFYRFCETAKNDTDNEYFFIIDEINRGNLSKIFGELLMLIENDKRGSEQQINLVYGSEPFYIPENLYIIGMMNTADRSLAMIDYALRRRFSFYTMLPAFEKADENGFAEYIQKIECPLYHSIIAKIIELNKAIKEDTSLGKGFEIGHSYFISDNINDEWVKSAVEYEIIPLIEEYWFDNESELSKWKEKLYLAIGELYDE